MWGHSIRAGARSNVNADFFSLQLRAKLAPLFVSVVVECLSVMWSCNCLKMELQVVATVGAYHTLIVNEKRELYITSRGDSLSNIYHPEPQNTLRLIFSQPTTNCILQISAISSHAAFVTKTGQVTKSFLSLKHSSTLNVKA
jgi:alpha-tubulin suppressor-like RCC1 family protein